MDETTEECMRINAEKFPIQVDWRWDKINSALSNDYYNPVVVSNVAVAKALLELAQALRDNAAKGTG